MEKPFGRRKTFLKKSIPCGQQDGELCRAGCGHISNVVQFYEVENKDVEESEEKLDEEDMEVEEEEETDNTGSMADFIVKDGYESLD